MQSVRRTLGHTLLRVKPGLWQLVFNYPAPTNCWLWQERDGITLIDSGHPWNAQLILSASEIIGQQIKRIVLTHGHPDHAGAAAELSRVTEAPIYAHECEVAFLQGKQCLADEPGFWMCRGVLAAGRAVGIVNPPRIDEVASLVEGDTVGSLQVIHTPGHTPGSISLWSDRDRALICGDNVCASMGRLHIGLPWFTLDLARQRTSVAKYKDLPARLLLSGHGPAFEGDVAEEIARLVG